MNYSEYRGYVAFERCVIAAEEADPKLATLKQKVRDAAARVDTASGKKLPRALRAQMKANFALARYVS